MDIYYLVNIPYKDIKNTHRILWMINWILALTCSVKLISMFIETIPINQIWHMYYSRYYCGLYLWSHCLLTPWIMIFLNTNYQIIPIHCGFSSNITTVLKWRRFELLGFSLVALFKESLYLKINIGALAAKIWIAKGL